MSRDVNPQPRKNLLKSDSSSPMQFMREELIFDSERNSLVRFRGPFIMPNWLGVEDNEYEYEVDSSWVSLDQLAKSIYGDHVLMWVIAARNHLDLPDVQVYMGKKLKIPNKDWVEDTLLPQGRVLRGDNQ